MWLAFVFESVSGESRVNILSSGFSDGISCFVGNGMTRGGFTHFFACLLAVLLSRKTHRATVTTRDKIVKVSARYRIELIDDSFFRVIQSFFGKRLKQYVSDKVLFSVSRDRSSKCFTRPQIFLPTRGLIGSLAYILLAVDTVSGNINETVDHQVFITEDYYRII